jgi:Na+/H+-dicarboxylate symporter
MLEMQAFIFALLLGVILMKAKSEHKRLVE